MREKRYRSRVFTCAYVFRCALCVCTFQAFGPVWILVTDFLADDAAAAAACVRPAVRLNDSTKSARVDVSFLA